MGVQQGDKLDMETKHRHKETVARKIRRFRPGGAGAISAMADGGGSITTDKTEISNRLRAHWAEVPLFGISSKYFQGICSLLKESDVPSPPHTDDSSEAAASAGTSTVRANYMNLQALSSV